MKKEGIFLMSINLKPHSLECGRNFRVLNFGSSKNSNKPHTLMCGKHKNFLISKSSDLWFCNHGFGKTKISRNFWIFLFVIIIVFVIENRADASLIDENFVPGEINIKYKDNIVIKDDSVISELARLNEIAEPDEINRIIPDKNFYNLKFNSNESLNEIIEDYSKIEEFEYAEPNYIMHTFLKPNDPRYSDQWGVQNINSEFAWNLTKGNKTIIIAIIDTGIDWNHPDLSANIWNNSDENCSSSTDLDNNGYNGDCRGYDFVDINVTEYLNAGYQIDANEDYNITDNNPSDVYGHGTHTAGIAGAVIDNNEGIAGVCWNCSIMPVRAGFKIQDPVLGWLGSLEVDDISLAIHYAADNNATIISMSFGGSNSSTLEDAINYAANKSILIASAGNDGTSTERFPAAYSNVIGVAAIDSDNTSASYSNYGSWINIAAPGTNIWSTYYDDTYASQDGTSMAAPFVAGAAALIKSLYYNKNYSDIKQALNSTGINVNFNEINIPRINVYSAILSLDNFVPNVILISPNNSNVSRSQNQTFLCNATDWQLKNITIQLWNSSNILIYNETKNISGIFNQTEFNVTNLLFDSYKWNCMVYDNQGNYAYAQSNYTLYIGNLSSNLVSPPNNTFLRLVNQTNFSCYSVTLSAFQLSNITLNIWNSSNVLIYNETKNISGIENTTNFNYNFSLENIYFWNCKSFNNRSESVLAISNFTIGYDITSPRVELINPSDSLSYSSNQQTIAFEFNASDNIKISNCTLIINQVNNLTNFSISTNSLNTITQTFDPGVYNCTINCSDSAGNMNNSSIRIISINSPTTQTTSSGGGGGTSLYKVYIPSTEQMSQGYTENLKKNEKIKFIFFDEKAESHYLIVNEIKENYVNITIKSANINLMLGIGQSIKLNLTSKDFYDLYIKLNSITNDKIGLTIQTIKEPMENFRLTGKTIENIKSREENETEETKAKYKDEENAVESEPTQQRKETEVKKLVNLIRFLTLIIIVLLTLIFSRIIHNTKKIKRSKRLKEYKNTFNSHIRPNKLI